MKLLKTAKQHIDLTCLSRFAEFSRYVFNIPCMSPDLLMINCLTRLRYQGNVLPSLVPLPPVTIYTLFTLEPFLELSSLLNRTLSRDRRAS